MSSIIKIPTVINKVSALVNKVAVIISPLFLTPQNLNTEDTWLPGSTNNAVSWRRPDLSYMRNEIRISIIEFLNATVTSYPLIPPSLTPARARSPPARRTACCAWTAVSRRAPKSR